MRIFAYCIVVTPNGALGVLGATGQSVARTRVVLVKHDSKPHRTDSQVGGHEPVQTLGDGTSHLRREHHRVRLRASGRAAISVRSAIDPPSVAVIYSHIALAGAYRSVSQHTTVMGWRRWPALGVAWVATLQWPSGYLPSPAQIPSPLTTRHAGCTFTPRRTPTGAIPEADGTADADGARTQVLDLSAFCSAAPADATWRSFRDRPDPPGDRSFDAGNGLQNPPTPDAPKAGVFTDPG
jgi:hypothetical protein